MPLSRAKALAKDILYFGVTNMLYTLVQLLAMPVVIRGLSMGEVASWNILLPTGVLLCAVVTFGMDAAIVRFAVDQDESRKRVIYSTGFYFVTGLAALLALALWTLSDPVMRLISLSSSHRACYLLLLCWLPGVLVAQFAQNWLKYSFQRQRFISLVLLQSFSYLVFVLCLKLGSAITLYNVILGSLVGVWSAALLGLFYCRGMLVRSLDGKVLCEMLCYGAPFMVMAFGFNLIFSLDKYLLSASVSQHYFAVYSQAFRIAAIFSMVVSAFNFAFGPYSLDLLQKEDAAEAFADLRSYYLLFAGAAGACFIAVSKIAIFLLAGSDYLGGADFVPFFVAGYLLYGLFSFSQLGLIHSRKSYLGLYVLAGGLAAAGGLDLALMRPVMGYGTALGFLAGNLAVVVLGDALSKRFLRIAPNRGKDLLSGCAFLCAGLACSLAPPAANLYLEGAAKLVLVGAVFCSFLMLPPFRPERSLFRELVGRRLSGAWQ